MKKYILFLIYLFLLVTCYGQTRSIIDLNKLASVPVPSPNVAALNKFVEFPVSNFNGTANVSFPLYEIKLKNVSVPITLKYYTGGIRVNEEASWVGLGWSLDAGGVITHQIRGVDDLVGGMGNYIGKYFPYADKSQNEIYNEYIGGTTLSGGKIYNKNGVLEDVVEKFGSYDFAEGDPDLYIYSMGNYSGKFINIDKISKDLSSNNIIFKHSQTQAYTADSIIATDPNGNVYKFKNVETSMSGTGMSSPEIQNGRINSTAYYLSEIVCPNKERVKFYYKSFSDLMYANFWESNYAYNTGNQWENQGYYLQVPSLFEECKVVSAGQGVSASYSFTRLLSYTFTKTLYLQKIEFPSGIIEFNVSPRTDAFALKLDNVVVKNNIGHIVKKYIFNYSYFTSYEPGYNEDVTGATNISQSYNFKYPKNYLANRLKLVSFAEGVGSIQDIYSFKYEENQRLPYKTSFSQDFWGYFNGMANKTLIPSSKQYASIMGIGSIFTGNSGVWATANRNVNPYTVQTGVLKEITYPTKGKTSFEYEPNECINSFLSSSSIETKSYSATDLGTGYKYTDFTFNQKNKVNINIMLLKGNASVTYNTTLSSAAVGDHFELPDAFYVQLEKYDSSRGKYVLSDTKYFWNAAQLITGTGTGQYVGSLLNQELPAGKYRLTANFPDKCANMGSLGSTMANIYLSYDTLVTASKNYVGGLRIKKVIQIDPVNNQSIIKNYQYKNGILATHPLFCYSYVAPIECGNLNNNAGLIGASARYTYTFLTASPVQSYSFSANGSIIGYKNVTETFSNGEIGKIDYEYHMDSDMGIIGAPSILPGLPTVSRLTNGFLRKKIVYNSTGLCLENALYEYSLLNTNVYWGFKIDPTFRWDIACIQSYCFDKGGLMDPLDFARSIRTNVYFYPIIQGKIAVKKESIEDYRQGVVPPIQVISDYTYNSLGYLSTKKIKDSSSKDFTETYKYVPDKTSESIYSLMSSKNIVSLMIESSINHNGSILLGKTNYSQPYTGVFVPASIQQQTGTNPVETRITYHKYDKYGNPVHISKDGADNIVYIWGYNNQFPIAEIRNATYAQITPVISEATLNSIAAKNEPAAADWTLINNLRTNLSLKDIFITTYTYRPLIGILTTTDPSGLITYYDYDSFGRLKETYIMENGVKRIIQSHTYHYQNQ